MSSDPDATSRPIAVYGATGTDDELGLHRALDGCATVVACAGPFTDVGEPVLHAAIAAGTHYVDTTGEQAFIKRAFEVLGPAAERANVAVVSGMGFDYLPGDLLCAVTAEGARS